MKVELITATNSPEETIRYAISRCYQQPADDKVLKHCLKAGHLSVLEHASATFEITVSLQTLLQLTRHRHLSFTCQSSRGSLMTEVMPTGNEVVDEVNMENIHIYQQLITSGVPYEEAALMLPKGIMYNLLVTGNFRAWYEYLPKRLCKRAQGEHREVAQAIRDILVDNYPIIFEGVGPDCKNCKEKGCSFHDK